MEELEQARALLAREGYSCVLWRGGPVFTSRRRGVAPLLECLESGRDYSGCVAADKVVGRATAFLYRLLGVRAVCAQVMSRPARQVLEAGGIALCCDTLVPAIRNREGTGPCPMEEATAHTSDPREALAAVRRRLEELKK